MATATKRFTKKVLRVLSGVLLTYFIIVLVDLQLRTRYSNGPGAEHGAGQLSNNQGVNFLSKDGTIRSKSSDRQRSDTANGSRRDTKDTKLNGNRRPASWSSLTLLDIFVAVKTTGRFHRTRLDLLLETWISITKEYVSVCLNECSYGNSNTTVDH